MQFNKSWIFNISWGTELSELTIQLTNSAFISAATESFLTLRKQNLRNYNTQHSTAILHKARRF